MSLWAFRFLLWYICVMLVQPQNRFTFLWPLQIADLTFVGAVGLHILSTMEVKLPVVRFGAATNLAILLLVRPLAGVLSLAKSPVRGRERWLMAFLGIRGIGSIYYVAYGLNHGEFGDSERLWAAVGFLILASIVLHGLTSDTLLRRLATRPGTDQPTR